MEWDGGEWRGVEGDGGEWREQDGRRSKMVTGVQVRARGIVIGVAGRPW